MDENNLNPDAVTEEVTTQVADAIAPASDDVTTTVATPPSVARTPFDEGVLTTEEILAHKSQDVTSGKNAGTTQYIITTKSGKKIWHGTPPAEGETSVSFGLTAKGYTNFIGYSSFRSLSVEQRFAKASSLARQNAVASTKLLEESKCPEALASLLNVNIKDLL